jgi:hypothetical protein
LGTPSDRLDLTDIETKMPKPCTLTELLEAAGYRLTFRDMGRRIVELPRDEIVRFERSETAYPLPLQQQAWLGLLLLNDELPATDPLIWFIRLPLDEQGKLVLAARDEFLHRLLESLGDHLQAEVSGEKLQTALEDNPFTFRPKEERMAVLHAKITLQLDQPPSRYYSHARKYFNGEIGWDQWSFLGYQGIADMAIRQSEDGNQQRLAAAIPRLPPATLEALCHCLENEAVSEQIAHALRQRAEQALAGNRPDPQVLSACLRGISQSHSDDLKRLLMEEVLSHDISKRSDILAPIGARAWECLLDDRIRDRYLVRLAENDQGQAFFDVMLSDLLYLPDTRAIMLSSLRSHERPSVLERAIGEFFSRFNRR